MDLTKANGISTPFTKEENTEATGQEDKKLGQAESRAYRSVTASGNCLGHDRPDVQLSIANTDLTRTQGKLIWTGARHLGGVGSSTNHGTLSGSSH